MTMPYWQWRPVSAFLIGSVLISATFAAAQQPTPPPKHAIDSLTMDLETMRPFIDEQVLPLAS